MKPNSKVTYKTPMGKVFKTIVPVSEMNAFDYMKANYNYDQIDILTIKPSVKKSYKRFVNVEQTYN